MQSEAMPAEDAGGGAVLGERHGTPVVAHYGSVAAEIAVGVKAAGLTERWDLHQLAVRGREPLLEHALAGAAGVSVPAPGRAVQVAGTWCCRTAPDRAIVAGPPAAVDRWQRVMRQAGRATGAGLSVALVREAAALSIVGPRAAEVLDAAELPGHELADRGVAIGLLAGCRVSVLREDGQRFLLLCAEGCSEAAHAALWRAGSGLGIAHVGCDALDRLLLARRGAVGL